MAQTIDVSGLPQPVVDDIQRLVATLHGKVVVPGLAEDDARAMTLDEVDRILDAFCEGLPPLSVLPSDFSRSDIYCDHN